MFGDYRNCYNISTSNNICFSVKNVNFIKEKSYHKNIFLNRLIYTSKSLVSWQITLPRDRRISPTHVKTASGTINNPATLKINHQQANRQVTTLGAFIFSSAIQIPLLFIDE